MVQATALRSHRRNRDDKGNLGAKRRAKVVADILLSIKERM